MISLNRSLLSTTHADVPALFACLLIGASRCGPRLDHHRGKVGLAQQGHKKQVLATFATTPEA
jgi:hypothetical protein